MKILFLTSAITNGGVSESLIKIVNYANSKNIKTAIATTNPIENCLLERINKNVEILYKSPEEKKLSFTKKLIHQDYSHYIGVQSHNSYWLAIAILKTKSKSKKIISWDHSSPFTSVKNEYKKTWLIHWAIKNLLSLMTNAYFCVSRGAAQELQEKSIINKQKIHYTPNIIYSNNNLLEIKIINRKEETKHDECIKFISIGRISKEKGLDIAINALSKINKFEWTYTIVGDGPEEESLKKICSENEFLKNRIKFLGWKNNINDLIRSYDALILSSYYEGLPTVLVEASLAGLPIISSDCKTGPNEIIVNNENGLLFKTGSAIDLHEKIIKFINEKNHFKNSKLYVQDYEEETAGSIFLNKLKSI